MSEVMTNQAAMYDSVEAIRNLNSVEGFNPRDFMRVIQGEGESAKYYLDVAFRKLWFRLKYPEGRISKRLLKLENDMAVIEARVYLNYRSLRRQPQPEGRLPMQDSDSSLQTARRKQTRR